MLYHHCYQFCLENAIRRVREKEEGLKLNGTHHLLVYADDVNMLGWEHTYYKEKHVSFNSR